MGKISNSDNVVQVRMSPEEIVFRSVPIKDLSMSFGDLIGIVAWQILLKNAPKFVKGKEFKYRSVDAEDGQFVITFHQADPARPVPEDVSALKGKENV